MKLANIRILAENTQLDPKLAECVNKVALARPALMFTFEYSKHKTHSNVHSVENSAEAPDGGRYARRVEVTQDATLVGHITVSRHYHGLSNWRISVASRMVRPSSRRRGDHEETHTTNVETAVRSAKKFLVKPQLGVVMYERGTDLIDRYDTALRMLEAEIGRGRLMGDQAQMQLLLNSYLRGQEPDEKLAAVYKATVTTPQYEKALSEYMLAQHMRTHPDGVLPVCLIDGLYAFFTGGELLGPKQKAERADVQLVPFEALPLKWQNNLAVLQLMENNEVVKDIGFRLDEANFLIIK